MLSLLLALLPCVAPARAAQSDEGDGRGFLNIALPPSGEMLVENRRGGPHNDRGVSDAGSE